MHVGWCWSLIRVPMAYVHHVPDNNQYSSGHDLSSLMTNILERWFYHLKTVTVRTMCQPLQDG
jgi:hypothetical protein